MKKFEDIAKKALEEANKRKKDFSSKEIKTKETTNVWSAKK